MGLKKLCCEHLQFMWDNHLLERRKTVEFFRTSDGCEIMVPITKGFRVRRSFFFFPRDRILYNCPFCNKELIFVDGVIIPELNFRFYSNIVKIGGVFKPRYLEIPMSDLKEALFVTKRRCKHWPPKD